MKINTVTLLFVFLISFKSISQTKTYTLSISDDSKIKAIKRVSDSGFIIHTMNFIGSGIPGQERSLTYLDNHLNERWNMKPISNASIISSSETPYVYQISRSHSQNKNSVKVNRFSTVQFPFITLTRINQNGNQETLNLLIEEASDDVIFLASAIDKENIYYISYNTSDKRISGNLFYEKLTTALVPKKLHLRKMAHSDNKFTEVEVNLEFNEKGDLNFLGCNNGLIYIYQKIISEDGKQMEYVVYIIDKNGTLNKKFTIHHSIADYFAPLDYNREFNGGYSPIENFEEHHTNNNSAFPEYFPLLYSLSNLEINFKSGKIFLYGLTNKKKSCYHTVRGEVLTGLYFNVYTLDGTLMHSINEDITELVKENNTFTRYLNNQERAISFDVLSENLYRINIGSKAYNFTTILLSNDKIVGNHTNENNYTIYGELAIFNFPKEITYKMNLMASEIEAPASYISFIKQNPIIQSKKIRYLTINNDKLYFLIKYEQLKQETLLTFMLFE